MIKLKPLLLEDQRTTKLSWSEALDLYKKNCKNHDLDNDQIYRGTSSKYYQVLQDPKAGRKRKSTGNRGNQYTLLIDNLSDWKEYPKRSRSLICTMSLSIAKGYGNPYVIIPYDNSKIGVAPTKDIWYGFKTGLEQEFGFTEKTIDVSRLNQMLDVAYGFVHNESFQFWGSNFLNDNDFMKLKSQIKEIDENIDMVYDRILRFKKRGKFPSMTDQVYRLIRSVRESTDTLFTKLRKCLNPTTNGFQLKKYDRGFTVSGDDNEVWTDGKCLVINYIDYTDFAQAGKVS